MTTESHPSTTKKAIDWDAVKERLRQSELALERSLTIDEERIQTIFHQRAEKLAARQAQAVKAEARLQILVFHLAPERYGIELRRIAQVVPFGRCTPVPEAPSQLLGVTNQRGDIRSVMDLRRILELPELENDEGGYILFVRAGGRQVGFRVDQIENVQSIDPEALTVPTEGPADLPAEFLRGLTPERVIVLSTEAIFAHPVFKETTSGGMSDI